MWKRFVQWIGDLWAQRNPAIENAQETLGDLARKTESAADQALPDRVRGVRTPRARYLLILLAALLFVGILYAAWRLWPAKPAPSLTPVATVGGEDAYTAPQVEAIDRAEKRGTLRTTTRTRPVATYRTEDLPRSEQDRIPVAPPPTAEMKAEAAADNCLRDGNLIASDDCRQRHPSWYLSPELAHSAVVPPSRGDTEVRSFLMPSGRLMTTLEPKRERFWGWTWKHVELDGGYGSGGKQVDMQATWLPLRLGNVQIGARAEGWTEPLGEVKAAGSVRIRWEPFRDSYR